ncbi:MAG: glycosyltransferase family 1 protein [Chloroflexi bacterium]|nr:glycosyltransferase family 1 protein [Chloroflexota bacterium]OJV91304.1 MAG: hypothetical protein BGO39_27040 [Chloroflexi bacterium 54-19]
MTDEQTLLETTLPPLLPQEQPGEDLVFPEALRGKRILIATESLGPVNGVSRATLSLIEYLNRHEVPLAILAPRFETKNGNSLLNADAAVRLKGVPLPYNPELQVVFPFRLSRVYRQTFQPDLIYLASPASLGGQILWQLRGRRNPPVVVNFQTDLAAYARTIFPFGLNRITGWAVDGMQSHLFRYPAVRKVFYPSSASGSYLEKLGVSRDKLVRVGRGVNTTLFNPSNRDEAWRQELAPNGEIILGCVSRISLEKGFDFLAQVALKLAADNFPFKMLITGGNRNPLVEKNIRKLFGDLDGRQVVFTGLLQGQPLARAYATADIFVYPSLTETFGQVIQEAMASGLPVIARNQGGPGDIVQPDKTGYLIPPDDLDGFVAAIKKLASQPQLQKEFSEKARQLACQATWENVNNQIARHFSEALED